MDIEHGCVDGEDKIRSTSCNPNRKELEGDYKRVIKRREKRGLKKKKKALLINKFEE